MLMQKVNDFASTSLFLLIVGVCIFDGFHQLASANLLCRNCGHSVTTASALRNVKSPRAIDHWNLTVLGVDTLVQVFKNSVPETFNVITVNGADLKFSGKSYAEETWFPGMRWTACVCSSCSSHVGWYFESQKDDFVGLVLDYLISSEYADTLTMVPLQSRDL